MSGVCCWLQLGQYDKAIVDYTRALEVDPANSFAYYNRGITKDRMGDFEGAVADFSSAIALDPKNADFYHNRGFSLRKQVRSWLSGGHDARIGSGSGASSWCCWGWEGSKTICWCLGRCSLLCHAHHLCLASHLAAMLCVLAGLLRGCY